MIGTDRRRNVLSAREESFRTLSPLVLVTGLVLTLQNPLAVESARQLVDSIDWQGWAQALERPPQGTPPWLEGDALATEDVETSVAAPVEDRALARGDDLRQRPSRTVIGE